jgi:hypothetical protein
MGARFDLIGLFVQDLNLMVAFYPEAIPNYFLSLSMAEAATQ